MAKQTRKIVIGKRTTRAGMTSGKAPLKQNMNTSALFQQTDILDVYRLLLDFLAKVSQNSSGNTVFAMCLAFLGFLAYLSVVVTLNAPRAVTVPPLSQNRERLSISNINTNTNTNQNTQNNINTVNQQEPPLTKLPLTGDSTQQQMK